MALIPEEIIAQVVDRTDIVETISAYVPLKRAGRNFKTPCPFHNEKTPSFVVNPDKQIFHCFGCGVGGNVVSFVMKHEHMEFPEALRFLAQRVNIEIPTTQSPEDQKQSQHRQEYFRVNELVAYYYHKILLSDKSQAAHDARAYLKKRGVDLDIVKHFKLGIAPDKWDGLLIHLQSQGVSLKFMEKCGLIIARENKEGYYDRFRNRIIFPIFDTRANVRAFGARAMDDESGAKYINSPETPVYVKGHHLYGFHLSKQSISKEDQVIIVEGYMDCLMPYQYGATNIVASLGTALTVEQIRLLRRYTKNIVLLFDSDAAGQAAMMRSFDTLIEEGVDANIATLGEGEDPDSFIRKFGLEKFKERINNAQSIFEYKLAQLMTEFDYKTVEGKAKISESLLSTVGKYDNEILKAGYIKRLSQTFMIPEQALKEQLGKVNKGEREVVKNTRNLQQPRVLRTVKTVEHSILKLLLEEDEYLSQTKEELTVNDFQDGQVRSIISKLFDWADQGQEINVNNLLGSFDDPSVQRLMTELITDDENLTGDHDKMHRDFLKRIKHDRLKRQKKIIMQQMHEAEVSGNIMKLDELKKEFNQLVRK